MRYCSFYHHSYPGSLETEEKIPPKFEPTNFAAIENNFFPTVFTFEIVR